MGGTFSLITFTLLLLDKGAEPRKTEQESGEDYGSLPPHSTSLYFLADLDPLS